MSDICEQTHSNEAYICSRTRDTHTHTQWESGRRWIGEQVSWQHGLGQNCALLPQSWKTHLVTVSYPALLLWARVQLCCWPSKNTESRERSTWPPLVLIDLQQFLAHLTIINKHSGLKGATTWISKNKTIKPFWFIKIKDTLKGDTFSTRQNHSPWMIKATKRKRKKKIFVIFKNAPQINPFPTVCLTHIVLEMHGHHNYTVLHQHKPWIEWFTQHTFTQLFCHFPQNSTVVTFCI